MTTPEDHHNALVATIHDAKKAILVAFIPLFLSGIGALVFSYFELRDTVREVTQLNLRLDHMARQIDNVNERVIVMWAGGQWELKYPSKQQ